MQKTVIVWLFLLFFSVAKASDDGLWKVYLSFSDMEQVEETPEYVYAVANGSLVAYGKEDNSVRTFYKGNGLNDNSILWIRYNRETNSLLLVYENGNIDIMEGSDVYNLPYLANSSSVTDKTINSVMFDKEFAYLSGSFGIMVVNMEKKEITDTYRFTENVFASCIYGEMVYALTESGIRCASLSANLIDRSNWTLYKQVNDATDLFVFEDQLCYFISGTGVYRITDLDAGTATLLSESNAARVRMVAGQLACFWNDAVRIFRTQNDRRLLTGAGVTDLSALTADDTYWVVRGENGLQQLSYGEGGFSAVSEVLSLKDEGPLINAPYHITCNSGKVYVVGGGKNSNGTFFNNPGRVMVYDYNRWTETEDLSSKFDIPIRNFTKLAVNPKDPTEWYVASCGEGLIRYKDGVATDWYTFTNSTLESILPDISNRYHYVRVDGVAFDAEGNLWMNSAEVDNALSVLDTEKQWHAIYVESLSGVRTLDDLLITSSGKKWLNVPRVTGEVQLTVVDNGNSLDDAVSVRFDQFTDQDGNSFVPSSFTCMAEDRDGYLWVGTDRGPVYFSNPDVAISDSERFRNSCMRVKLPMDDGTNSAYYFLDNVRVTAMAVDAGNRKWFGTADQGVYVLGEGNDEVIHQFTTENSPLLSNTIYAFGINHETGDVFIGTDRGLVSYRGEATEGKSDYSSVRVYPNPVRPAHDNRVTVAGLMENSNVKITDLNGNLIYQTRSVGGQVIWDCRNYSGRTVASGIYLVLSASEDAAESVVAKIAVVN